MSPHPESDRPVDSGRQLKICRPSGSCLRDEVKRSSNEPYLVSCDDWTWDTSIGEGGTGRRAQFRVGSKCIGKSMTYIRVKPSGDTLAFSIRSTALGPIAAETLPDMTERSTKSERNHTMAVKRDEDRR
jgi:hypothetical protein